MASAHVMVDGYGNIFAPLLPLLIPKMHLSLAAAGTLTMFFQLAASVAQVGFGSLADRWRPRLLVMAGPVISVSVLSLIGLATSPVMLGVILIAGGLGAAAFHPPAAALAHRLGGARPGFAMSVYITGGTLGFPRPADVCPVRPALRPGVNPVARAARTGRRRVLPVARAADASSSLVWRRNQGASSIRQAARAAVHHRRPAHADGHLLRHVRAGDADPARPQHQPGRDGGRVLLVCQRGRGIFWRPARRSFRGKTRDRAVPGAGDAISGDGATAVGLCLS